MSMDIYESYASKYISFVYIIYIYIFNCMTFLNVLIHNIYIYISIYTCGETVKMQLTHKVNHPTRGRRKSVINVRRRRKFFVPPAEKVENRCPPAIWGDFSGGGDFPVV